MPDGILRVLSKARSKAITLLLFYFAIAIILQQQQFGAESFSHHNNFNSNRTKVVLRNYTLNSTYIIGAENSSFQTISNSDIDDISCQLQTPEHHSDSLVLTPTVTNANAYNDNDTDTTMKNRYNDLMMEELRKELLETVPGPLLEASSKNNTDDHSDSDINKAVEFLATHSRPDKKSWKQNLEKFVAIQEALKSTSPANVIPQGPMEQLLEDHPDLLEEMLLADGASGGNYGKAMEIYQEIYSESDCVDDSDHPILHRLAVAIALVHATPVVQINPSEPPCGGVEEVVDPVGRYLNYEVAYLEGELDPDFDTLTTWELRFVVDGDEPDEAAAWGRKTLRNFRPDHVLDRNHGWLYAGIVRSDIPYGSSRVKDDDPSLHRFQNILRNGGICGRRAFFGRFILRAFGIPTTARPSKGHAALCHWKPDGTWEVNLGGVFGKGWTKTRYVKDLDFESMTRARVHPQLYEQVKLAQWIGDLFLEKRVYGIHSEKGKARNKGVLLDLQKKSDIGMWYRVSLKVQETILTKHKNSNNASARKKNKGASVDTIYKAVCEQKSIAGSCSFGKDGSGRTVIRIPASSYANPKRTKDVKIMKRIAIPSEDDNACNNRVDKTSGNQQIYLPSFKAEGTTIMRGGTCLNEATGPKSLCNSGGRVLSDGKGKYENWGMRAAMTVEGGEEEDEQNNNNAIAASCPEPSITVALGDGVTLEFVYIPPGKFVMGGTKTEDGRFACVEVPHHPVEITKGFYIGKYPVTQEQYTAVYKGKKSTKDPHCPADNIGVEDALGFCEKASEATGVNIRLPTEAEWEYSARGSTHGTSADSQWFFGDLSKLGDYAWYKDNADGKSHPVGQKKPNPFGLYDVYGNACERVSDTYLRAYYALGKGGPMVDPTGPSQGTKSRLKYKLNVPESGKYFLTARVCTVNVKQRLRVSTTDPEDKANDETGTVVLELPYTLGDWKDSNPVPLKLKQGDNILHFWRDAPPQYGIAIQEFVLTKAD